MSAYCHVSVRLRTLRDFRGAWRRRFFGGLCSSAHGPRQAARGRGARIRGRGPGRIHRREALSKMVEQSVFADTARTATPLLNMAASLSAPTAFTRSSHALLVPSVQREAATERELLYRLERASDVWTFRGVHRPERAFAAWPTNDGLTLVICGWPIAEFDRNKRDIDGNYRKTLELVPAFASRLHGAKREAHYAGSAVPNSSGSPSVQAGRWSGTQATTRISLPLKGYRTPSGTPNYAPTRWISSSPAPAP